MRNNESLPPTQLFRAAARPHNHRVFLLLLAAALLWTFGPFLFKLDDHLLTSGSIGLGDGRQNMWQLWWTADALLQGRNPFFTDLLHYPEQVPLFWQTVNVTNGFAALPLTVWFGPLVSFNLMLIGTTVTAAAAMYLLLLRLGARGMAATAGALIYGFSPFHLQALHDGQLEIASIYWFPLISLALWSLLQQPRATAAGSLALLVLGAALTSHYFALFSLLYLATAGGVYLLVAAGDLRTRLRPLYWLALVPLPLLTVYALQIGALDGVSNPSEAALRISLHSLDLADIVQPSPHHPLWGDQVRRFQAQLHPNAGMVNVSLGILPWALACYGLLRLPRRTALLHGGIVAILLVLAMGPTLRINGSDSGIRLPYGWLLAVPGMSTGQRPNHLMMPVAVHIALLAAYGVDRFRLSFPSRPLRRLAPGTVILLLAVDLTPLPFSGQPLPPVAAHQQLGDGRGAVLELPYSHDDPTAMVGQFSHQRPILGGYLARLPEYRYLRAPGIRTLIEGPRTAPTLLDTEWKRDLLRVAAADGIERIVIHLPRLNREQRALLAELRQLLPLRYEDRTTVVFDLPATLPPPEVTAALGPGWHALESDGRQWTGGEAALSLYRGTAAAESAVLSMSARAPAAAKTLTVSSGVTQLDITVSGQRRRYHLLLPLRAGRTDVTLRSAAEQIGNDPRELGIGVYGLTAIRTDTSAAYTADR
jgi:hypothetical protein